LRAVGARKSRERPSLDHSRKSVTFRSASYCDAVPGFEQISHFDFLADLVLRHVGEAEFFYHFESAFAGFRHMPLHRLVDPLGLFTAKNHFPGALAVFYGFLLSHTPTGPSLVHLNGIHFSSRFKELVPPNFSAY